MMSDWSSQPKHIGAITLFVEDLNAAKEFYTKVFDLPVYYEDPNSAVFQFGDTLINLLISSEGPKLITPAKVASQDAGSRFQFTVGVENVDRVCEELARRGIAINNGPIDRPWGIRTATFVDPGGHIWEIAHDL
jgi:catechol 2,3-dioxygenase-like lactoylglutathione lyase family enzyme